jgi:hypothetical protein
MDITEVSKAIKEVAELETKRNEVTFCHRHVELYLLNGINWIG